MSSANRGECVTTGGLYRPTHLCVAHFKLHKKFSEFFCDGVSFGGVWGVIVHASGGRGLCGVSERGGVIFLFRALTAWGKKLSSSLAERALMLWYRLPMVGSGRDCGRDGWGCAGGLCKGNVQDGGVRGTDDLCSVVHCPLEGLAVCCTTVPVPDRDTAGQHTLNGSPVEVGEDGWLR